MLTNHLTEALLELTKQGIRDYHRALIVIPKLVVIPVGARTKHGINLGILLAHQTVLESPHSGEGLPIKTLNEIAEDLVEVLKMLPELIKVFGEAVTSCAVSQPEVEPDTLTTTAGEPADVRLESAPNQVQNLQDNPQ